MNKSIFLRYEMIFLFAFASSIYSNSHALDGADGDRRNDVIINQEQSVEMQIAKAICSSHRVRASKYGIEAAQARVDLIKADSSPSLALTATNLYGKNFLETPYYDQKYEQQARGISLINQYLIFDNGVTNAKINAEKSAVEAKEQTRRVETFDVALDAMNKDFKFKQSSIELDYAYEFQRSSQTIYEITKALSDHGVGNKADVFSSEARLKEAGIDVQRKRLELSYATISVQSIVGVAKNTACEEDVKIRMGNLLDPSELIEINTENFPTIMLVKKNREVLKKQLISSSRMSGGTLALRTRIYLNGEKQNLWNKETGATVSLELSIPIFDGGKISSTSREISSQIALNSQLENEQRRVVLESWALLAEEYRHYSDEEILWRDAIAAADSAYNTSVGRFKSGVGSLTEMLIAQRDLFAFKRNRIFAFIGRDRAFANLGLIKIFSQN